MTVQTEDAMIASRIVQPMDYSQKSLEMNAIGQFGQKMILKGGREGERNCAIIFALLFLALDLSLIVSVKRLIKAGSKIQGAAAAVCYGIFWCCGCICVRNWKRRYVSVNEKDSIVFLYKNKIFCLEAIRRFYTFLFYILMIKFCSMHCWSFALVVYFTYEQIDMRAKCSHIYQRKNEKTSIYNYTWQMALES